MDNRGFLDGRIVGVGRVPLGFMSFRAVRSSCSVTSSRISRSRKRRPEYSPSPVWSISATFWQWRGTEIPLRAPMFSPTLGPISPTLRPRARSAQSHLSAAGPTRLAQAALAGQIGSLLERASHDADDWVIAGAIPEAGIAPIEALLHEIDQVTPALRAELRFTRVKG